MEKIKSGHLPENKSWQGKKKKCVTWFYLLWHGPNSGETEVHSFKIARRRAHCVLGLLLGKEDMVASDLKGLKSPRAERITQITNILGIYTASVKCLLDIHPFP